MKKDADKGRKPLEFQVGDMVLFKLSPNMEEDQQQNTIQRGLIPSYDHTF